MTELDSQVPDTPEGRLILDYWDGAPEHEDAAAFAATKRVLDAARAGNNSRIEDQVQVAYLLGPMVRALRDSCSHHEFGWQHMMWQATVPVGILALEIALFLEEWADICEERWDMYRRVDARPDHPLAERYPADLLAGHRLATEDESRRLAGEDAAHLRAMAAAHRECFQNARKRLHMGHIRPPDEPLNVPTALYFWYDAEDVLLYIGITGDLATRQTSHAKRSSWSEFADHSKVHRFPSRPRAEAAEKAAIEQYRPLFNRQHNDTPEARARLVAYLIEHGRMDLLAPAVSRG